MTATTTATTSVITAPTERGRMPSDGGQLSLGPVDGPEARQRWAAYVGRHTEGTFFHLPQWAEAVAGVFGHRDRTILARRDGEVVGVLPLMEVRSLFGGRLLVSVPYGTYGGVLSDNDDVSHALATEAVRQVSAIGARVLDLRSARAAVAGFECVEKYDSYVRDLPESVDALPGFFPKRARAAARQARERTEITVRHDPADLKDVWKLYARSMRRIGSLSYPYRFFLELTRQFGAAVWVSTAWQGDALLAGTISIAYRETLMPYVLGIDERVQIPGATNLLYYDVMELAIRSGLRRFDYGRTRKDNPGSAGFKKNQGFKPVTLGYQRYVPVGAEAPDLTPSNSKFRLMRKLWPHLPLPLARGLSAWLSKSLPG